MMSKVDFIFWFAVLTFVAPLVNPRPRNSRLPGTLTACESRRHLTDLHGTLSSPNFPGSYPANSSCTWIITTPQHVNLSVRFISFNISSDSKQCGGKKCGCDFVRVKELDPPLNVAGFNSRFCNDNPPNSVYNLVSRVKIRFVSDSAEEGMGFQLKYQTFEAPTTAPVAFDFTQVQAQIGGRSALPVNQTAATTTVATSYSTDHETQSMTSPTTDTSGVKKPLSAFTNNVTTNTAGSVLPSTGTSGPTVLSKSLPVTGVRTLSRTWTETTHVVMVVEKKKVVEKVPDIIILGPSVPVVMIFVLVVAGIAWWNYKFDTDELNRYESYTRSSKAKNRYKKSMQSLSKGNLYNEMTKNWKGQSFSVGTGYRGSPMVGKKTSFAGRFLEIAEGVITPRPSRPPSAELAPLTKSPPESPTFLSPDNSNAAGGGSRPSSRPASLLLRDALINMFGGSSEGSSENRDSASPSKRASKRVSFIDESGQPLVQSEASPSEGIEEKHDELNQGTVEEASHHPAVKPRWLQIPAIVVRHPSEDHEDETQPLPVRRRKDPIHEFDAPVMISSAEFPDSSWPVFDENDEDALGQSEDDDRQTPTWDDYEENYPDSSSEEILDRSLIFPDLEDFLLNLDKDSVDEPPYSCASHVRDILRKSYGDEGPSGLGPGAVLNVPEEFLGMIRSSPRSYDIAKEDPDEVDDVD